jgi:hypothetical protein
MWPGPAPSNWTTFKAVLVERLLIDTAFVTEVFVEVTEKFPVTVRFAAMSLSKEPTP